MPESTKIDWSLEGIRQLLPDLVKSSRRVLGQPILDGSKKLIGQGQSPVEKEGRFRGYSPSYQSQIKRSLGAQYGKRNRPINLRLSGDLMASGYAKEAKEGVVVGFSDWKAKFHNTLGAGKSKILRRMLPTKRGETFKRVIMSAVMKLLATDVIRKAIARTKKV